MSNFNDIQNLWQNQPRVHVPDVEAIKKGAARIHRQIVIKNVLGVVTLLATLIFIAWIGLTVPFKYITTKAGIVVIIISITGGIVMNSQMLQLILSPADHTLNNQAYLQQLIEFRNRQRFFQTTGISVYYALLSFGFVLYLYEFYPANHAFGLTAYGLTFLWIAFAWFYIKPRTIKKQEEKINALIEQIKSISGQLNETD